MTQSRVFCVIGANVALVVVLACRKEVSRNDVVEPNTASTRVRVSTSAPSVPVTPRSTPSEPEAPRPVDETRNGWGAANWGMTEAEVRAVYPSVTAIQPPGDYDRIDALATWSLSGVQAADLEFTAKFLFGKETNTLVMVLLSREPEQPSEYTQVYNALIGKYGLPARSKELSVASLDKSSTEQERKTRIGSASSSWVTSSAVLNLDYLEAMGTGYLLLSYKAKPDDRNL